MATADFEEIEDAFGECESEFARWVGAVVSAGGWSAGGIDGDAARDDAAWIGVFQRDFKDGGRAEAHRFCVAMREMVLGVLVVGEGLFEF